MFVDYSSLLGLLRRLKIIERKNLHSFEKGECLFWMLKEVRFRKSSPCLITAHSSMQMLMSFTHLLLGFKNTLFLLNFPIKSLYYTLRNKSFAASVMPSKYRVMVFSVDILSSAVVYCFQWIILSDVVV